MPPWAEYSITEWLWTQLRAGLRRGPVSQVPRVDHPGCANGTTSRRQWFTWQQANAVSVFEIQLLRDIVAVLAQDGIEPVDSWLTQQTRTASIGGYKALLDSTGTANGAYLTSYITLALGAIDLNYLARRTVPALALRYPFTPTQARRSFNLDTGPCGFGLGVQVHQPRLDDIDPNHARLVITSPIYYCRYYFATWPGTVGDRNWPLAPADERTPIVYPNKPRLTGLTHRSVEDAASAAITKITDWATFLNIDIGEFSVPVWQRTPNGERYLITAPVSLNEDLDTIWRLSRPYSELVVHSLDQAHRLKRPAITIRTHGPLSGEITDNDGHYELTITSVALP